MDEFIRVKWSLVRKEGLPDRCQSEGGKCCFLGYKELKRTDDW